MVYIKVIKRNRNWTRGETLHSSVKMGTETAPWLCWPFQTATIQGCLPCRRTQTQTGILRHPWSNIIFSAHTRSNRYLCYICRWDSSTSSNTWPRNQETRNLSPVTLFLRHQLTCLYHGGRCWYFSPKRHIISSQPRLHSFSANPFPTLLPKWSFQNQIYSCHHTTVLL